MPFRSQKQRRFMHSQHPQIARRWENESKARGKRVAEKRKKKSRGKTLTRRAGEANVKPSTAKRSQQPDAFTGRFIPPALALAARRASKEVARGRGRAAKNRRRSRRANPFA
jgi:hypothetical protein